MQQFIVKNEKLIHTNNLQDFIQVTCQPQMKKRGKYGVGRSKSMHKSNGEQDLHVIYKRIELNKPKSNDIIIVWAQRRRWK